MYHQFAKWTTRKVWVVTRMRVDADCHVTKAMVDRTRKQKAKGMLREQWIRVGVKVSGVEVQRLKLRRIVYKTDEGKVYECLTNNFGPPAKQIARVYKNRWMMELLFKQIKQNFPLRYFRGEGSNAIKMQVYCVLIAQLLMVVIRKKAATRNSFANMITANRLHMTS